MFNSMSLRNLCLAQVFISFCLPAFAQDQAMGPSSAQPVFQLNDQQMADVLKEGEMNLRKIKGKHLSQEQRQHEEDTELAYQAAVALFHQKRMTKAKTALLNVEDSMADYKSTLKVLKLIDNQSALKLRIDNDRINQINEADLVNKLTQQAAVLYQKTSDLDNDQKFLPLREKLAKVTQIMGQLNHEKQIKAKTLKLEVYSQNQFDQLKDRADQFDEQVAQLVKEGKFEEAEIKYNEFESAMTRGLLNLKETVNISENGRKTKSPSGAFKESEYQRLEKNFLHQGVILYESGNYEAARIIFNEMASHGDAEANAYLKKTDRLLQEKYAKMDHGEMN